MDSGPNSWTRNRDFNQVLSNVEALCNIMYRGRFILILSHPPSFMQYSVSEYRPIKWQNYLKFENVLYKLEMSKPGYDPGS